MAGRRGPGQGEFGGWSEATRSAAVEAFSAGQNLRWYPPSPPRHGRQRPALPRCQHGDSAPVAPDPSPERKASVDVSLRDARVRRIGNGIVLRYASASFLRGSWVAVVMARGTRILYGAACLVA